jgi:hypothetical protein
MPVNLSAAQFVKALKAHPPSHDPSERKALLGGEGDEFLGVRMGHVFALAKTHIGDSWGFHKTLQTEL